MKHCPFCGAKIEDSARFCLYCMSSLDEKQVWQTPRRHIRRWQACLAALCAFALSMEVVHLSLNKLPVSAPIGSAESSAPEHSTSSSDEPYTGTTSIVTNPVTTSIVTNPVTTSIVTNPITTSIITGNNTTSIVTNPVTTSIITNPVTTSIVTNRVTTSIVTEAATTKTSESTASRSSNTTTERGTTITPTISTTPTSTSTSTKTTTTTKTATTTTTVTNPGEFVPDYRPGYANTVGNSTYSIFNNDGHITRQDQWLYYYNNYQLHKVRVDGTEKQAIADVEDTINFFCPLYDLNVIGDWLYYTYDGDIYRMRTDGSCSECLYDQEAPATQLYVIENRGYFVDENGIHRIDLETKECTTLNTEITNVQNSYQNSIRNLRYLSEEEDVLIGYATRNDDGKKIRQYALSTPDALQWSLERNEGVPLDCLVTGDTLFHLGQRNIYTADLSSSAPSTELLFKQQYITTDTIYGYSPYKGGLLIVQNLIYPLAERKIGCYFMDGTTALIEAEKTGTPYYFGDDYAYYTKDGHLYRANADLTEPVQLTK